MRGEIMKTLLVLLSLTLSVPTFASQDHAERLLKLLIENSNSIKVVDPDSDEAQSIAQLLAETLSSAQVVDDKSQVVTVVRGTCKNTTPEKLVGVNYEKCILMVLDSDYKKTDKGLVGPTSESSISFKFELVTPVVPNPKSTIKNSIVTIKRAG